MPKNLTMSCAGTYTDNACLAQAGTYVSVLQINPFAFDDPLYSATVQIDSAQAATLVSVLDECKEYRPGLQFWRRRSYGK